MIEEENSVAKGEDNEMGTEGEGGRNTLAWNQRGGKEQVENVSRCLYTGSACHAKSGCARGTAGVSDAIARISFTAFWRSI